MAAENVDPVAKRPNQLAICESYPSHLLLKLEELRQQEALCDVTINIGGQSFHAHRAVLAASSGYFMGMFSRGFVESHKDEVDIQGDADSFKCLLQFAYTGKLPISETNAYDVIVMANYLQFTHACDTALNFVRRYIRLSPEDAFMISVLDFVKPQMVKRLQYYLLGEMKNVMQSQIFLQQASDLYMEELLAEKDLAEANDNEVVQAVVAWLVFDWETRKKYAFNLIIKINFDKVTKEVLEQIVEQDILGGKDCKELHDKVTELLPELKTKTDKKEKSTLITAPFGCCYDTPGLPDDETHMEYLTYDGSGDSRKAIWKHLRPFTGSFPDTFYYSPETVDGLDADVSPRGLTIVGNQWLIVGGDILYAQADYRSWPGHEDLQILYRYHFKENTWKQVFRPHAALPERFQTIYMDKCLYFLDTAEGIINSYDTATKTLNFDHKYMSQQFYNVHSVISVYMGRILVYGPLEEDGNCVLQAYDPAQDLWYQVMEDILPWDYQPYGTHTPCPLGPIIMQHNGTCYRVAFLNNCCNPVQGQWRQALVPIVHELNFQSMDAILSAKVGELVDQSHLPIKTWGAFQIDNDLLVYGRGGLVYRSGQKAWNGPWNESKLEAVTIYDSHTPVISSYVRYTFDSLQLADDDSIISNVDSDNGTSD